MIAATDVDLSIIIAVNSSMDLSASLNGDVGTNLGDVGTNLGASTNDYIA